MLPRGFKTWCENISLSYRKRLKLRKSDPLNPHNLASYLNVNILTPNDIHGLSQKYKNILLGEASSSWSAVTTYFNNSELIIINPRHSTARKSSDLMHELAHIIIGHAPSNAIYSAEAGITLRQYNQNQEEEADWFAGALLLPKDALIAIKWSGMTTQEACHSYVVSNNLLIMRLNVTGVNYMYARANKRN